MSWRTLVHMYWTTIICIGYMYRVTSYMYWTYVLDNRTQYIFVIPHTYPRYISMPLDTHTQYILVLSKIYTQYIYSVIQYTYLVHI